MSAKPAKAKRVGMEVSIAVSHAVQLSRAEAIAAYPITPQTHIVEHLSSIVANGELEGYDVTEQAEREGGYEAWTELFPPQAGKIIVQELADQQNRIVGQI